MATNRGLRALATELKSSRLSFIQSLAAKRDFESECTVIIPELERLWEEKILTPFDLPKIANAVAGPYASEDDITVVNWKHYLFNYSPFLLKKAITRLAKRLEVASDGSLQNSRGPVKNIPAYFKALVQDLRLKDVKKAVGQ